MVTVGIPRQIRDQPVILMPIVAIMGEYQVRRASRLQRFEELLDLITHIREKAVPERLYLDLLFGRSLQKLHRAGLRLDRPSFGSAEDNPVDTDVRVGFDKLQQRPPAADFEIV